jgi:hypothetical protein
VPVFPTGSRKYFRDHYSNAIYFHLGGLDLYPEGCSTAPTHTKV